MGVDFRPLALQVPLFPTHLAVGRGPMGKIGSPGEVSLRPESQRDQPWFLRQIPKPRSILKPMPAWPFFLSPCRLDKSML